MIGGSYKNSDNEIAEYFIKDTTLDDVQTE